MADAREPEQGAGSQEPPREQGSPAGEDLFDRWLAHRAEGEDTAPRPRTYGVPRTGVPRTEDEATRETTPEPVEESTEPPVEARGAPATSHETQPAPLDLDTGEEPGEAVVDAPATEPSGKHPAAPATSTGLTDFEPVVLASVRRSEQQRAPASRFGRRRRAGVSVPDAPGEDEASIPEDEIPGVAGDEVSGEDAAETEAESPAETEQEARAEDTTTPPGSAAAEVFAAFNGPIPGPIPDTAPGPTPDTAADTDPPAESSDDGSAEEPQRPRPRTAKPREPETARTPTARPAVGAAVAKYAAGARDLLDRAVRGVPEDRTAAKPAPPASPTPTSEPAPAARHDASGQEATTERPQPTDPVGPAEGGARSTSAYDALRAQREAAAPPRPAVLPPDIDFGPRTLARQVTSLLLLVGIALTLLAAWRAYDSRVQTDIGFAAILALFTGIVWAVRAGSVPTRMSLHGGLLEVRTQAGRFLFELTSAHTHLEQVGTPGRPGWKVLVHRRGMHPFEITRGMVDPHEFLDAVRYYRPDL